MACPAILTGDQFITRVMSHIDCQAANLGTLGWQALGQPGSLAATMMVGLLTIFIALFGIRMLFGPTPGTRDLVGDVLKIGIVLALAFSWPAFRTLIHDVVIDGPGELAASAGAPLMSEDTSLVARLQQADNAMLRLIEQGTGRQSGEYLDASQPGATFRAQGLEDESSFGTARLFFLSSLLATFGLLRIVGGFLLALGPLAAGMLLFEPTRGLFAGWLRGLVLALLGGAAISVVAAGELAILLPWLSDALKLRGLGYATPSAPTELLALTLGFAVVKLGTVWLMAKVAFARGWISIPSFRDFKQPELETRQTIPVQTSPSIAQSRSERIVESLETQMRREEGYSGGQRVISSLSSERQDATANGGGGVASGQGERLGSSWRRTSHRGSIAATRRDRTA